MITTRSDLDRVQSENRQPIRGVSDISDDMAYMGVQALATPGSQKKKLDKKKSSLWVYDSPSIS